MDEKREREIADALAAGLVEAERDPEELELSGAELIAEHTGHDEVIDAADAQMADEMAAYATLRAEAERVERECAAEALIAKLEQRPVAPYGPTWVETGTGPDGRWLVYDQAEGFQPAVALVMADDAAEAAEVAASLSGGRLDDDSETLVVWPAGDEWRVFYNDPAVSDEDRQRETRCMLLDRIGMQCVRGRGHGGPCASTEDREAGR